MKTDGTACQRSDVEFDTFFCFNQTLNRERITMDLQTQLEELKTSTQTKLAEMKGNHAKELQDLRVAVLGKKAL